MAKYQAARQREGRSGPVPVQEWSREFMEELQTKFGDFLRMDLAESTRRVVQGRCTVVGGSARVD
jgi:hypothetical protein